MDKNAYKNMNIFQKHDVEMRRDKVSVEQRGQLISVRQRGRGKMVFTVTEG
jgi:hypothetical protein